jgi:hypothetical protein
MLSQVGTLSGLGIAASSFLLNSTNLAAVRENGRKAERFLLKLATVVVYTNARGTYLFVKGQPEIVGIGYVSRALPKSYCDPPPSGPL